MFNRLKQEITMKKYIAPVAKTICFDAEESMLVSVSGNYGDGEQLSNRREEVDYPSVSDAIWGNSWED